MQNKDNSASNQKRTPVKIWVTITLLILSIIALGAYAYYVFLPAFSPENLGLLLFSGTNFREGGTAFIGAVLLSIPIAIMVGLFVGIFLTAFFSGSLWGIVKIKKSEKEKSYGKSINEKRS